MKIPRQLMVKLSPLVEAARGEPLVEPFLELSEEADRRLLVRSSYGSFVFDRGKGDVVLDDLSLVAFGSIQSVDIAAFPGGRGEKSWSITLYRGFLDRITVARTYDDGEASVVAAKLSRLLDCNVINLSRRA
jgi:hypothetical protein